MTIHIGMLLYPGLTQLDLTGPFEVLHRVPGAAVHLLWKDTEPVISGSGMAIRPNGTLEGSPALDVIFVPGGFGQVELMRDEAVLAFVREHGQSARYVTAVCTGSLLLGAAGLLDGYEATTHWAWVDLLATFGARYIPRRVVVDRNRITGGGVTAGIDFGLELAARLSDEQTAKAIQLGLEYDPSPPFQSGHPDVADPRLVEAVRARLHARSGARFEGAASGDPP